MTEQIATEGRIVHVRTPGVSHCQPAIVVRNWSSLEAGAVNVQIFRDGTNDRETGYHAAADPQAATVWATSVSYADQPSETNRTWHWPERV